MFEGLEEPPRTTSYSEPFWCALDIDSGANVGDHAGKFRHVDLVSDDMIPRVISL